MSPSAFRIAVEVAVSVFIRTQLLNTGPLSEEEMWFKFEEWVRNKSLSRIVGEDTLDDDIPF